MVPVGVVQVGCAVTDAVGVAGAEGIAFTVSTVAEEIHPVAVFFAVILYVVPCVRPVKVPLL